MKIAVVGAGGVGGYFGGRLALAGHDVAIVARGPHLAAIRERGLGVRSIRGDFTAVVQASDDPAEFGPCEVVLFCVKSYDTEAAAARLGPLLGEDTAVVSLQNGIDNEERIAAAFICAVAGMTAAVRLPLGEIRDCAESWDLFRRIVVEVAALAAAEGVRLGEEVVEQQVRFAAGLPPESYSSLHHDLVNGRRMELEALHGAVVRRAARRGVPVPANDGMYAILRPWALRNEDASG